jgi:hypothetical protein
VCGGCNVRKQSSLLQEGKVLLEEGKPNLFVLGTIRILVRRITDDDIKFHS